MWLTLDGQGPLGRRLYDALRTAILDGRLAPGARLPSSRALSRELGVSRNTALAACERLIAPRAWVKNNERISNEGDREGWLALYAPEVVFEAITDGSYERRAGLEQMRSVVHVMCAVLAKHRLRVQKRFVVGTPEVVVNGWIGGFGDRQRQHGIEVWTLRPQDGLVVRHEMYTYCDVRPGTSLIGRLRVLFAGEARVKLALATGERRARSASERQQ